MALTELKIKNAKPKERPYKLADAEGLYLLINPNGSKLWRLKYRVNQKEKVYSIGIYPEISLGKAREERFLLKKSIKSGIDPAESKKIEKLELHIKNSKKSSFEEMILEWHERFYEKWTPEHAAKILGWIKKDIIPIIGFMPINDIKAPHILAVVKRVEERGANDVARRVLSICSQVFRYAMPLGKCEHDVTIGLHKTLEFVKRKNYKCIAVEEFPALLNKIKNHNCSYLTRAALQLIAYTFVRSSELREAKWSEINFETKEWRIPAARMKMREPHIVPLSKQVVTLFQSLQNVKTNSEYIFPNENNFRKVMSENTMLYALYDMGYHNKMTVHGFRQLASTILNEKGFNPDAIERQLSHAERNNVRRAYNHAQYLNERMEMMQWWADYIDGLRGTP